MTVIDLRPSDGPICPNDMLEPVHETHRARTRVLNAYYTATPKDADGEMVEPAGTAYTEAAYGTASASRMRLYVESASFIFEGRPTWVEAWFFRCGVCGLILPASPRALP